MFERLHRAFSQVIPKSKSVALFTTLATLGVGSFIPYFAEELINNDDELRVEYIFQRDRIKTLKYENDSLQKIINQQSIEFSKQLYETTVDFNKRIIDLENLKKNKKIY